MRFDPQAGFTPVSEADAPMATAAMSPPEAGAGGGRPSRALPRWLLAWLVMAGLGVGAWKICGPLFAPKVLQALTTPVASADDDGGMNARGGTMSDRLAQALQDVLRGGGAAGLAEPRDGTGDDGGDGVDISVGEGRDWDMFEGGAREREDAEPVRAGDAAAAIKSAERLIARGQHAEAANVLTRVLEESPGNAAARYKLGLVCAMQRDFDGARAQLEALRKLDPSLASLLSNLVPHDRAEKER